METTLTLIPKCSIHPGQINIYNEIQWEPQKPTRYNADGTEFENRQVYKHLLNSNRSANGKVSKIAKRKMTRALNYLLLLTNEKTIYQNYSGRIFKFKIAFITLTLPSKQKHTDNEIKNLCLNSLIIELKKYYHIRHYIWRAEKQENGNIHFHLLVDKFIPYQNLRDRWNRIINKLGYVDRYREEQINWHQNGFKVRTELLKTWPKDKQQQAYNRNSKLHWNSPNSTDIHSIQKIRNIKLYITKYITKQPDFKTKLKTNKSGAKTAPNLKHKVNPAEGNRQALISKRRKRQKLQRNLKVHGRIWGCDNELTKIKGAQSILDGDLKDEIDILVNSPGVKVINDTYYTIIFFDFKELEKLSTSRLYQLFMKYILDTFDHSLQLSIAA